MNPMERHARLVELLKALIESKCQADSDFCGEQREWHLPRLNTAFALACQLFPDAVVEAMSEAKTPYGDKLVGEEG